MPAKRIAMVLAALAATTSVQATTVFAVDENNNLITFDSSTPGATLSSVGISGTSASLKAIDFRPINNVLYGLSSNLIVYTINQATGLATAVSGELALVGTEFAFDFNPTIDRLRIVSNTNQNYVFNPLDGTLTNATNVAYAAGDPNFGANPDITAGAYTTSTFGAAAASTQLYSIDSAADVLTKQANSAGTLTTVGALGFDLGTRASFDILGSDAFVANGRSFYSANLASGALTELGQIDRNVFGIAVTTPVPEPATWAMMVLGFGMIGAGLRRRNRTGTMTVRYG